MKINCLKITAPLKAGLIKLLDGATFDYIKSSQNNCPAKSGANLKDIVDSFSNESQNNCPAKSGANEIIEDEYYIVTTLVSK